MVLGHTGCGAVDATIKVVDDKAELLGHLPGLVNNIKPAVERARAANRKDLLGAAVVENVRHNVEKLKAATPIVSRFVEDGKVKVVGGLYTLKTGAISLV
ncbi:carbonic anhydrase [Aquabacter sp. CN5-332]|uniref:carbonic anhydrase n=1 Tax=Aquabacter sp. CN5-332 TaxID=3156608 RepID=UPI0032B4C108